MDVYSPVFYLRIFMTISTLLSLYAFNVMVKTSLFVADRRYHLMAKYNVVLVAVVINSLQPLIIELLAGYDVIPCTQMIHWQGRASGKTHYTEREREREREREGRLGTLNLFHT